VKGNINCLLLLSHSINMSLEHSVPCFELEPIRMEAARGGLCPGVDAKGLLKEEEDFERSTLSIKFPLYTKMTIKT